MSVAPTRGRRPYAPVPGATIPELDIVHVVVSHRVPSGREQMQQLECRSQTYSINSSAPSKNASDMFSPSAWAVLRLITSWYLDARSTGRSAGLAPFIILATSLTDLP